MILFFQSPTKTVLAVEAAHAFSPEDVEKLVWAFSEAKPLQAETLEGWYVGPRREMITPWSTNAVEITQNMGLTGISRIEEYFPVSSGEAEHDPMLQRIYDGLNQDIFTISKQPDPIVYIEDIEAYKDDVRNILRKLKMFSLPVKPRHHSPRDVENLIYLEALETGCWLHHIHSGDFVEEGQVLGRITDVFGNTITTYYAEQTGVILYVCPALSSPKGTILVAYGTLKEYEEDI